MFAFRDISIKQKLILIIQLTSSIAVLAACLAFVATDLITFKRSLAREVATLAEITGINSTAALVFHDRKSAEETLAALSAQPHIVFAGLYEKGGKEAATYTRRGADVSPIIPDEEGSRFEGDHLHMAKRIMLDGEQIGMVYLQYDLEEMRSRTQQYAGIMVIIMAVASFLAFLLSANLQHVISKPLLYLADVAKCISRDRDFSVRAQKTEKYGRDEIGILIDGFNEMLTQVQDRDARLEQHREELEEQVALRTAELRKANQELVAEMAVRKRAEKALASEKERLAVTLRSIGDGVIVTDLEGRIVLASKVAEELTGWPQEHMTGVPLSDVFVTVDPATRRSCGDPIAEVLGTGGIVSHTDPAVFIAHDGTERIMAYNSAPVRDRNGSSIGVILAFRDITEKQKAEEELLRGRKLESIGILAGGIAHDFNNFLTAILGNISLAKMLSTPSGKAYSKLAEAEKASLRAKSLTQQLLTFSKGGEPVKKSMAIAEILQDSARFTLAGSNVKCDFFLPEDLWAVEVDEGQIGQVINNLLINACQAMPHGGVIRLAASNVTVEAEDPAPLHEGSYVKISFEDQGNGIPKEHLQRIFDPYFTTKEKGTGLGLATCYSIVRRHGGMITAESEPGRGTIVHVYLPASKIVSVTPERTDPENPLGGGGRVLIMDDEDIIRDVAGELLAYIGYDVVHARDGAEAIELYEEARRSEQPFDAVIMDLTIPGGMGGGEAVRRLLALDPQAKAIASSGYAQDPIMAEYSKWGFCGVVAKPYRIEDLSSVLRRVIADSGA